MIGRAMRRLVQRAVDLWNVPAAWTTVHRANVTDYTQTGRTVREQGWERHPVVSACCRAITDIVQAVPLEVVRDQGDDVVLIEKHPLGELLRNPQPQNPNLPGSRFMGLTALHFLLYGNALWDIRRGGGSNRGLPSGLRMIHPEYLRSVEYDGNEDRVLWYDWSDHASGQLRRSAVEDVVHFADLAGDSWIFGYPRAASAIGEIVSDAEATRYVRQVVTNDGGPSHVFHMQEGTTRDTAKALEESWQEKRVNRGQRGMVAFMAGSIKSETIGFNLQQLEFPDLRRVTREGICTAFGVDPRVIGISSAANDSGLSGVQYIEARKRLIAQAVVPLMFVVESHINHWLAVEYGEVRVRFSPNGLSELTEDETQTSERARAEYAGGIRTLEEARELVGLPTDRDPTHHIKGGMFGELTVSDVGALALPGTQAMLAPPEPPPGKEEPPPQRTLPRPVTRVGRTPEQRAEAWRAFDGIARAHELKMEGKARALFAADAAEMGRLFRQVRAEGDPVLTPGELDDLLREVRRMFGTEGTSPTRWAEGMGSPISEAVRGGAGSVSELTASRIERIIRQRTDRLALHVGRTSATQIEAALIAGQQSGLGVNETAQMINQTVFGGIAASRSTTIARTETIGALNEGAYVNALSSGFLTTGEWLTQLDDVVRDTHAAQDGQRLPIGQTFPNGLRFPGDPMGDPSEIVNCRCTLLFD